MIKVQWGQLWRALKTKSKTVPFDIRQQLKVLINSMIKLKCKAINLGEVYIQNY